MLFAVTEAPSVYEATNKVAIVGLDGVARAKAQFQPRADPVIPNAAPVMGPVAEVVGSSLYYLDGNGVLHVLRSTGGPQTVLTLPSLAPQADAWYAISPDGSQVVVGVLTFPNQPTIAVGGTGPAGTVITLSGTSKFDLFIAHGSQVTVLQHFETNHLFDSSDPKVTMPAGWTATGPVVVVPLTLVVGGPLDPYWLGGPLCQIDTAGKPTAQVGGADCDSEAVTRSGLIACSSGHYTYPRKVDIRDQAGNGLWTTHIWETTYVHRVDARRISLSRDGQGISDGTRLETRFHGIIDIPHGFAVEGWLDDNTVMGRQVIAAGPDMGNLSWINLSAPTVVHDLGFRGDFVGTLG